ncbi:hypothetical protein [Dietzia sp. PP-33]|jgi:hypothetical protein|uniref:hypothetical protein n=1 Tax=Dietzia sp. PP-33 TaxID=2957500 RepID=UPI0029AE8D5D|nr:hypothetical protein [Dietzia sp. PP-33]MDX2357025.1 hypothetical protein [Dietzia sp. PP-33]
MSTQTTSATHPSHRSARTPTGSKIIPHLRNRVGGLTAFVGLALALVSLYLPWLATEAGGGITGLGLTEVLDLRAMAPVNFIGLVVLSFLASVTLFTRLGFFALANAILAAVVLTAHLAFIWVLIGSTGTSDPLLSGLPSGTSVTYGPYLAAVGFVLVIAGSAWQARSAEYLLPDRAEARLFKDS